MFNAEDVDFFDERPDLISDEENWGFQSSHSQVYYYGLLFTYQQVEQNLHLKISKEIRIGCQWASKTHEKVSNTFISTIYYMKIIPEFPKYSITKTGQVFSHYVNRFITSYLNNRGYPCVKLSKAGTEHTLLISRLLCRVYKDLQDLYSDLEVAHKDRNPANFSLANLQVLSKEEHVLKTCTDNNLNVRSSICPNCKGDKHRSSTVCLICAKVLSRTKTEITKEQIEYWVRNHSWVRASKELGLSDNGLRKRYKALGGDPKSIKR